ncbi:MAG TPA: hypothetical protein PLS49_08960, partial [Candidatus Woesebacteria bacterium]|nr:hypothetical protein [Candidatus Woesebacteria bacterium]
LHHPAQSPDLNPIELVWGYMKDFVEKKSPVDKNDLMELILNAWDSLSNDTINQYINSFFYKYFEYLFLYIISLELILY